VRKILFVDVLVGRFIAENVKIKMDGAPGLMTTFFWNGHHGL